MSVNHDERFHEYTKLLSDASQATLRAQCTDEKFSLNVRKERVKEMLQRFSSAADIYSNPPIPWTQAEKIRAHEFFLGAAKRR